MPGLLAALTATIPIPIQKNLTKSFTVSVDVKWRVLDENGNPAADVSWTLGTQSGQGGDLPVEPNEGLQLALTFAPEIVELTVPPRLASRRTARAAVRVAALDGTTLRATTGWVDLPPIELLLPVVAVPTIAIFFSGKFGNDALIAVPGNSPVEEGTVVPALDQLNATLGTVGTALQIGGLFVSSLGDIRHALINNVTRLKFRKGDSCGDLRDVQFAGASFTDWNGEDGDDHFASMMMIGPPNRCVDCFNDSDLDTDEGQLRLAVDNGLHSSIESLASAAPASAPAGLASVVHAANGWRFLHSIEHFENELSSYRFGWT